MPIPQQDDVQKVLGDFHDRLRAVIDAAWQEWMEFPDRGRFMFVARLRAAFVFDAIVRRAIAEFADDKNIHIIVKRQTVQFMFKDEVLVRFKKGNKKGIGSNITTQAVLDFIDPQRVFPGLIPDIMRVEICYMPDDMGVDLGEVAVVARDRHRAHWRYPLDRAAPSVVTMPSRAPDTTPPVVVPREPLPGEKEDDNKK